MQLLEKSVGNFCLQVVDRKWSSYVAEGLFYRRMAQTDSHESMNHYILKFSGRSYGHSYMLQRAHERPSEALRGFESIVMP
jgi:hypothetical protein